MTAASAQMVRDYLRVRRVLGYKLVSTEHVLFGFVDYLNAQGTDQVTVEHALGFATAGGGSTRTQALRLSAIRCFARWAHTLDPTVQIPPPRLLPARPTRSAPYIYTEAEVGAMLAVADRLRPSIRAATLHTLIALMAATGIRTGEAIRLNIVDFNRSAGTLTVTGKYGKVRMLPLHPTATDGLSDYLQQRQRLLPATDCPALLISVNGRRLPASTVHPVFRGIVGQAGLTAVSPSCRPRLHDLRHSFAVATMLDAYQSGDDPAAVLPVLSTWLGHAEPGDTYWYMTGTAELLAAATARLNGHRIHQSIDPT
jgi:integrase/recombinase XerD